MGGLLGRNRYNQTDPFYTEVPPIPTNYTGGMGFGTNAFTQGYEPTLTMGNMYGEPLMPSPKPYAGRYAQGVNQMAPKSPWNYGNYYLGNTTMQLMPLMLNKVYEYGQMQAQSMLANAGILGQEQDVPGAPKNPGLTPKVKVVYVPNSMPNAMQMSAPAMMPNAMQMSAPAMMPNAMQMSPSMMASASPLPVALNPLVQGMYPMVTLNPVNWMSPTSFMSALSTGPMPYRPPGSDFPSQVSMVMTVPYGTPNPFLLGAAGTPNNSSFNNSAFGSSTYYYQQPASGFASAPIGNYQCPCSMAQSAFSSNPNPLIGMPMIQHIKGPLPTSALAPHSAAGANQQLALPSGPALWSSQGAYKNVGVGQVPVASSNATLTGERVLTTQTLNGSLPIYDATDHTKGLIGREVLSNVSTNSFGAGEYAANSTSSTHKYEHISTSKKGSLYERIRRHIPSISRLSSASYDLGDSLPRSDPVLPPILNGILISDTGWLPKSDPYKTVPVETPQKKRKRLLYPSDAGRSIMRTLSNQVSFIPRRQRRHRSKSSTSEYDCAICQQQREKRRLQEHYGSSTVSSLFSSKSSDHNRRSQAEPLKSSKRHSPASTKKVSHKSHRRHEKKIKNKVKTPSPVHSPVLKHSLPPKRSPTQSPISRDFASSKRSPTHSPVPRDFTSSKQSQVPKGSVSPTLRHSPIRNNGSINADHNTDKDSDDEEIERSEEEDEEESKHEETRHPRVEGSVEADYEEILSDV